MIKNNTNLSSLLSVIVCRSKHPLFPFLTKLGGILRAKKGSKLSRFARIILEHVNTKRAIGTSLALVFIVYSLLPETNLVTVEADENITIQAPVVFTTDTTIQFPVESIRITQGFKPYHKAIDMDGVKGDPIRPIMEGVVVETGYSRVGYGYNIVVDHGHGIKSLYAHLSKILVEKNEKIELTTVIGEMGNTGRSFGDHLHLEILQDGKQINPLSIIHN